LTASCDNGEHVPAAKFETDCIRMFGVHSSFQGSMSQYAIFSLATGRIFINMSITMVHSHRNNF